MNLSALLQRSEGDTLDFKSTNYKFIDATNDEKSELLKDIIAIANTDKLSDGHIIIGVNEEGGKATTTPGVPPELRDSDIQQFVNKKLNRPVSFLISHELHNEVQITVIRISKKQQRPIYLIKDFGKLRKNTVYIRHGSSTDEASPDEITDMAKQENASTPDVSIEFQINVNAYQLTRDLFGTTQPAFQTDALELITKNNGTALAKHIQVKFNLPQALLLDYLKESKLDKNNLLASIENSKRIELEASNYQRKPTHHYLARPNPLEWMPLLPGRQLSLFSGRTFPLHNDFKKLKSTIHWELAVDSCILKVGETHFKDIPVMHNTNP